MIVIIYDCDYIIIKNIENPLFYVQNCEIYDKYNNKYSSIFSSNIFYRMLNKDKINEQFRFYEKLFGISKAKISCQSFVVNEMNKDIYEIDKVLCNLITLDEKDTNKLNKLLLSKILAPYIHKHGFIIEKAII